jgi:hypothetical protein
MTVKENCNRFILNKYKAFIIILIVILINIYRTNQQNLKFLQQPQMFDIINPITYEFSNELALYFLNFAGFGYCTLEEMEKNECCGELIKKENWILVTKSSIDLDNYNFAVLRNDKYKKIIITFPGTRGITQLFREVADMGDSILGDDKTEKVMDYFHKIYLLIKQMIGESLKTMYAEYPNYQYIFTGHSLGGAMASIASLVSVKYENLRKTENSPVLITYGQPRTGNDIFANEVMNNIPIVYRIVRQGDLIATFPRCLTDYTSSYCQSILPDSKFTDKLNLTDVQVKEEESNFFSWHVGGLILYTNQMDTFIECEREYGENHPNNECNVHFDFSLHAHTIYFNKHISHLCTNRPDEKPIEGKLIVAY